MDRRIDFLNLPNGKAIEVPFDQLLIFSTNMQPQQLADEAFLRRIPYKIRVMDPSDADFKELFKRESHRLGIGYSEERRRRLDPKLITLPPGGRSAAAMPATCCNKSNITANSRRSPWR